jgi:comEA protein
MNLFSVLQQSFGFTRNEIKVVLFLAATLVIGLSIRWYRSAQESNEAAKKHYDYTLPDQAFKERSQKLAQLTSPQGEKMAQSKGKTASSLQPHSININTASKEQLQKLPGIGETYADRIVMYRDNNGPYASVDELKNVKGIGKRTLERLRPYIRVK